MPSVDASLGVEPVPASLEAEVPPPPPAFLSPMKRRASHAGSNPIKRLCIRNFGSLECACCDLPGRLNKQLQFNESGPNALADPLVGDAFRNSQIIEGVGPYVDTHCHLDEVLQTIRRHQMVPTLHKHLDEFSAAELSAWRDLGWATEPADKESFPAAGAAKSSMAAASTASQQLETELLPAQEVWGCRWDLLTEEQRQAATDLGYDSLTWNRNVWLLPRKTRWHALDEAVQKSLLRLGETPTSWDKWNGIGASAEPVVAHRIKLDSNDMRTWEVLTPKEKQAAESLGFTRGTFNCEEMAHLSESIDVFGPLFQGCVAQGCDANSIGIAHKLAAAHPKVYASFGCHPKCAWFYDDEMEAQLLKSMELRDASGKRKAIAWGEFGLDYSHPMYGRNSANRRKQKEVFARQLKLAVALGHPMVIHSRGADRDTLRMMRLFVPRDWRVHVHSFRGGLHLMEALCSGWTRTYIGVSGIVTMQDLDAQAICRACPLEKMVLETDAPYLPLARTHFSHPGNIPQIIAKVAELKGIPVEKVCAQVRENARDIYDI